MLIFLIATTVYEYFNPVGDSSHFGYTWCISAILLAVFLGLSFRRIRTLTKQLETSGIFCNDKLMFWHFGSFFAAAILATIGDILH